MFQAPAVGRKLWFFHSKLAAGQFANDGVQPLDATVCYVNEDGTVNLSMHDMYGKQQALLGITLVQEGVSKEGLDYWCEWMPYQAKQHEKAVAAETPQPDRSPS